MANAQFKITGSTKGNANLSAGFGNLLNVSLANAFRNIGTWFQSVGMGTRSASIKVYNTGVQASGTVTFSSIAAADTVTVNGVVFTASASPSGNNQFLVTGGDTLAAAALAVKLNATNAPNKVLNVISATSALAVITVTCTESGQIGNLCTLAISAHGSVSGANFTAGTDGTVISVAKGI